MADDHAAHAFFERIRDGRLNRRLLLKRAAVLGLSVPVMTGLLAACGGDDEDEPSSDGTDSPTAESDGAPVEETAADADPGEEPTSADTGAGGDATPADDAGAGGEETPEPDDEAEPTPAGEGQYGGQLKVAIIGEPPTLDIHQTTAVIVSQIVWNMYESLFTWDEEYATIPLLAESFETSEDGLVNTIKLRQGVLFHNGEEMKAADVIASFNRWAGISGLGKSILDVTDEIVEVDDYTIDFNMSSPLGTFTVLLARNFQGLGIYPKSVVDAAGDEMITEFIGTGPYMFTERQQDRYIRFSRFEDYAVPEGEPNGYGGAKVAYLDGIEFIPVPDEAARIAGLQAGDYHFVSDLSPDQLETFENDTSVVVGTLPPSGYGVLVLNMSKGVMTDQKIRQAFLAALSCEPMARAAQGEGYYRVDPGFMLKETVWHSTVSAELYDQGDPEKARELLEEAGYDGTALRFLTSQEYQDQYNTAVVAKQQLEEAGFTIELVVTDWATLIDNRSDENAWDVFTTWLSFRPDPSMMAMVPGCNWPGWWCTDDKVATVENLLTESGFDARYTALEDLQTLWYTEVPVIKVADRVGVFVRSPALHGIESILHQLQTEFVNVWLEEG